MTKNKNKNSGDSGDLDSLINACVDNQLNEEEATRLSRLIEESPEARERYWELASVHGMVEQSMQNASLNAATGVKPVALIKTNRLSYWRRLKGITAGMAIGVFSASLVWAYAIPRPNQPQPEKREIAFESFEGAVQSVIETIQMALPMARMEFVDTATVQAFNAYADRNMPLMQTLQW